MINGPISKHIYVPYEAKNKFQQNDNLQATTFYDQKLILKSPNILTINQLNVDNFNLTVNVNYILYYEMTKEPDIKNNNENYMHTLHMCLLFSFCFVLFQFSLDR